MSELSRMASTGSPPRPVRTVGELSRGVRHTSLHLTRYLKLQNRNIYIYQFAPGPGVSVDTNLRSPSDFDIFFSGRRKTPEAGGGGVGQDLPPAAAGRAARSKLPVVPVALGPWPPAGRFCRCCPPAHRHVALYSRCPRGLQHRAVVKSPSGTSFKVGRLLVLRQAAEPGHGGEAGQTQHSRRAPRPWTAGRGGTEGARPQGQQREAAIRRMLERGPGVLRQGGEWRACPPQ